MPDPHVKALHYRIKHRDQTDYSKAKAVTHREQKFNVTVEGDEATVEMIEHYATREEARAVVEPRLQAWELSALLDLGLDQSDATLRMWASWAACAEASRPCLSASSSAIVKVSAIEFGLGRANPKANKHLSDWNDALQSGASVEALRESIVTAKQHKAQR